MPMPLNPPLLKGDLIENLFRDNSNEKPFDMEDKDKTKEQLIKELVKLRKEMAKLTKSVAEHRQLDEELKSSENRYRYIFDAETDAIMVFDAETRQFVDVNKEALRLYGYTRKEFLDLHHSDITAEPEESENSIQKALSGNLTKIPLRYHKKKDGTVFPVEISAGSFLWKNRRMLCGVVRDITRRKQAEEEARQDCHIQSTICSILRISLESITLAEQFERILDLILSIPWLSIQSKGCIYLVEDEPEMLVLKVHRNFTEQQVLACSKVPFGKCLCGLAASTHKSIFADRVNSHQIICYKEMSPHGHYCVPILSGEKILGVICLYVNEGHEHKAKEEEFLLAVANTLSGIIKRKRVEESLQKRELELEEKSNHLEESNVALKVLLNQREEDKKELEENILFTMKIHWQ